MTLLRIPSNPSKGRNDFDIEIDGLEYQLSFSWRERVGSWYLDILDAAGVPLKQGIRIVVNWPLFGREKIAELPIGILQGVDVSSSGLEISAQVELGDRVVLVFTPAADVPPATDPEMLSFVVVP